MRDFWFKIKVSDLLLNPGKKDFLEFKEKFIDNNELVEGCPIAWKVEIQSLDHNTIWVTLVEISTTVNEECEKCWDWFKRNINIKNYFSKFVTPNVHSNPWEQVHDEEFLIEMRDELIDIKELINQAIILETPLIIKCENCAEKIVEEDEEEINNFESTNNIKWIK